jgi:hypothetical protein
LPEAVLASVEHWAMSQKDQPPRSQAIRRLVELGLTVKAANGRATAEGQKLRAREMAGKTIEKIIDPAAPPEERIERKRRLTKGPAEFREARVDQPKPKRK